MKSLMMTCHGLYERFHESFVRCMTWPYSVVKCWPDWKRSYIQKIKGVPTLQCLTILDGLEEITFDNGFNQHIPVGALPKGLKTIILGRCFKNPLPVGALPKGLQTITMGHCFNQPLPVGALPKGLQKITLCFDFN